jgi:hypothetical protein
MSTFRSIAGSYCQLYYRKLLHINSKLEIENTLKSLQKGQTHIYAEKNGSEGLVSFGEYK